jgi:hypothetical protein
MNLEDIGLSEISKVQKDKYYTRWSSSQRQKVGWAGGGLEVQGG